MEFWIFLLIATLSSGVLAFFITTDEQGTVFGLFIGLILSLVIGFCFYVQGTYETFSAKSYNIISVKNGKINAVSEDNEVYSVLLEDIDGYSENHKELIVKDGSVKSGFLKFSGVAYETK